MKKIRILLLDSQFVKVHWKRFDWASAGFELEIISIEDYHYDVLPSVCEKIRELTSNRQVDVVIIGNNMGVGLTKAQYIAKDLLPMTAVAWNHFYERDSVPYAELGINHFGRRVDLQKIMRDLLGISA